MWNRNRLASSVIVLAGVIAFLLSPLAMAQVVTEVAPISAEVGEVVQLTGIGFDPVESYTIHLDGGVSSPAANIQTDSLTFVVPAGARTGALTIETVSSGATVTTARPLTVLRQVAAQIDPALAAATAGYEMGTIYGDVGSTALVPVGEPGFVAGAGPADDDPSLMGVTTENTTSLILDADSTAAALVFMTPFGMTGDPVEAESRIATLLGLPETQALEILEAAQGSDHPDVSYVVNSLAILNWNLEDFAAARPMFERTLANLERALGPEHPNTASARNNLGRLLLDMELRDEARLHIELALAQRRAALGPDHPDVATSLLNLGLLQVADGDLEGARESLRSSLEIREISLGPQHRYVASTLETYAGILRQLGDEEQAVELEERAKSIRDKAPDHT